MHIGYVVKRYPRFSETFIVNEILAHERAGHEVTIYALLPATDTHFQDSISRVRGAVHYLPQKTHRAADLWDMMRQTHGGNPGAWASLHVAESMSVRETMQGLALAELIKLHRVDHLHAHFATSATSVARLASVCTGTPYTFTAHAKDIFHDDVNDDDLQRKFAGASQVITVSDFNVDYLSNRLGRPKTTHLSRVYNGLDLDRFPFVDSSERDGSILAVGRLVEKKGFADLIAACAELARRGTEFHCRIVGVGPEHDRLQALIGDCALHSQVELTGPMPQVDVIRSLAEAQVFAAPCVVGADGNRDGLPTVLLESMARGTPCIATNVTGISEVIRDGTTGLLIEPGDVQGLANGLDDLLTDNGFARKMAADARRLIERDFDIHKNTRALRDIFARYAPDTAGDVRCGAVA